MTDNEIIKALECCSGIGKCIECPYSEIDGCAKRNAEDTIALINRQKETIEQLQTALFKCGEEMVERRHTDDQGTTKSL